MRVGAAAKGLVAVKNANATPNPDGADGYRSGTPQQMNAEPGIQTYEDPDPQRSPALPLATPGLYPGTCGVYVNGGGGRQPGVSPVRSPAT